MHGADEFGPAFQRQLIRTALADPGLRSLVARFVNARQLGFSDPTSKWAWDVLAVGDHPTMLQLETEANRLAPTDPARVGLGVLFGAPDVRDDDYVRNQVVEWARRQVFSAAFNVAAAAWNRGEFTKAYDVMTKQLEEGSRIRLESADRGWFFEEFDQRQIQRWQSEASGDAFPIGIRRIDQAMNGGLRPGELEVPMAYSGIGKTFWVVQRGFVAARMRRRVLHFVLEGGRRKTEDRYEARWAHELYTHVRRGDLDPDVVGRLRREYTILRNGLVVRGFGDKRQWRITFEELLAELAELRTAFGWVPDLVIVDYGDIMWAEGKEEKDRQKTAFQQLKALSERQEYRGHNGYAVCAPSQAQRPGKGKDESEHVLKPSDIADAYDKVRVADAIISLNRTNEEKRQNRARVFLGKYRDDEDGACVRVRTDYAHGGFCELGIELDKDGREIAPPTYDDEPHPLAEDDVSTEVAK